MGIHSAIYFLLYMGSRSYDLNFPRKFRSQIWGPSCTLRPSGAWSIPPSPSFAQQPLIMRSSGRTPWYPQWKAIVIGGHSHGDPTAICLRFRMCVCVRMHLKFDMELEKMGSWRWLHIRFILLVSFTVFFGGVLGKTNGSMLTTSKCAVFLVASLLGHTQHQSIYAAFAMITAFVLFHVVS